MTRRYEGYGTDEGTGKVIEEWTCRIVAVANSVLGFVSYYGVEDSKSRRHETIPTS